MHVDVFHVTQDLHDELCLSLPNTQDFRYCVCTGPQNCCRADAEPFVTIGPRYRRSTFHKFLTRPALMMQNAEEPVGLLSCPATTTSTRPPTTSSALTTTTTVTTSTSATLATTLTSIATSSPPPPTTTTSTSTTTITATTTTATMSATTVADEITEYTFYPTSQLAEVNLCHRRPKYSGQMKVQNPQLFIVNQHPQLIRRRRGKHHTNQAFFCSSTLLNTAPSRKSSTVSASGTFTY